MHSILFQNKKVLKVYGNTDAITLKRAHFSFYLIIAGFLASAAALISTIFQSYSLPNFDIQLPIILSILLINVVFIITLFYFFKGNLIIAGNLVFYGCTSILWGTIIIGGTVPLSRLNTYFFILISLTLLPLIIEKKKKIFLFWLFNIVMLCLLSIKIYFFESDLMDPVLLYDTFIDAFLSMTFGSLAMYAVYTLNEMALDSSAKEIAKREEIAEELRFHKSNLEVLVEEQTIDLKNAFSDIKKGNNELRLKNIELENTLINLKNTQARLVQSDKMASLGVLTAGVAHEINNPLNYINGAYLGLEDYFKNKDNKNEPEIEFLLESIKSGLEKTKNIVDGLNQFSRTNVDNNETCDIHSILNNCIAILNTQIKYKADITKEFEANHFDVTGNNGRFHQVFHNILTNALDAISENGEIKITTKNTDEQLVIAISDNGHGIKKELIDKITDPFFTTKPPGKGTGLGLSISYSIINDLKGTILFKSKEDQGTTVIIKLPIYEVNI